MSRHTHTHTLHMCVYTHKAIAPPETLPLRSNHDPRTLRMKVHKQALSCQPQATQLSSNTTFRKAQQSGRAGSPINEIS